LHGFVVLSLLYYLPLYYEAVKELSPTKAGLALFPQTFSVAITCIIMGSLVTQTGHYRVGIWIGWLFTTVGAGILCLLGVKTSTGEWIFLNLVAGAGIGILYSALSFAVQASAAASGEDPGLAIAILSFFRSLGTVRSSLFLFRYKMADNR
jgi:fucose permease